MAPGWSRCWERGAWARRASRSRTCRERRRRPSRAISRARGRRWTSRAWSRRCWVCPSRPRMRWTRCSDRTRWRCSSGCTRGRCSRAPRRMAGCGCWRRCAPSSKRSWRRRSAARRTSGTRSTSRAWAWPCANRSKGRTRRRPTPGFRWSLRSSSSPSGALPGGTETAAQFNGPNQHYVALPDVPHGVLHNSPMTTPNKLCGIELLLQFVEAPGAGLDLSCVDQLLPLDLQAQPGYSQHFFGTADLYD